MPAIFRLPKLTLFGRSLLLIASELIVNVAMWILSGLLFGRDPAKRPILNMALLAWTLGLRHALDADHISAIDNATRGLIGMGKLPVTCGLFFSLGHSTVVIVVNVAIAISTNVYDKIGHLGKVGGIIGSAVSGTFLFIVGVANSVILWRIIKNRRRDEQRQAEMDGGGCTTNGDGEERATNTDNRTLLVRIIGPVITFVDHPWKMYPVGLLFGLSFDTASSIAILAISAIAKRGSDGKGIPPADIVVLPLLFTAGMTMIDSVDSILMLYSYTGFPERTVALFETVKMRSDQEEREIEADDDSTRIAQRAKKNAMSGLSIILTLMSIIVAFSISLIMIMGLIGENCAQCRKKAENGEGIAGKWWRGWADANANSGYIGAAIVGGFVAVVGGWYGVKWISRRRLSHGAPLIEIDSN